jgi:hypothetical protein
VECNAAERRVRLDSILHIVDRRQRLDDRVKKIQLQKLETKGEKYDGFADDDKENVALKKRCEKILLADQDALLCIQHIMENLI